MEEEEEEKLLEGRPKNFKGSEQCYENRELNRRIAQYRDFHKPTDPAGDKNCRFSWIDRIDGKS